MAKKTIKHKSRSKNNNGSLDQRRIQTNHHDVHNTSRSFEKTLKFHQQHRSK